MRPLASVGVFAECLSGKGRFGLKVCVRGKCEMLSR